MFREWRVISTLCCYTRLLLLLLLFGMSGLSVGELPSHDTPRNVVGLRGRQVILDCNRHNNSEIVWTYEPAGSTAGRVTVPRPFQKVTTSAGKHQLTLQSLELDDAGKYYCDKTTGGMVFNDFDAAAAFVGILADTPSFCHSNLSEYVTALQHGDAVKLTCWATYSTVREMSLTITWLHANGTTVISRNFTAGDGLKYNILDVTVEAQSPVFQSYICQLSFYIENADKLPRDFANNEPTLESGNTCRIPIRNLPVTAHGGSFRSQSTAANHDISELTAAITAPYPSIGANSQPTVQQSTYKYLLFGALALMVCAIVVILLSWLRNRKLTQTISRLVAQQPIAEVNVNETLPQAASAATGKNMHETHQECKETAGCPEEPAKTTKHGTTRPHGTTNRPSLDIEADCTVHASPSRNGRKYHNFERIEYRGNRSMLSPASDRMASSEIDLGETLLQPDGSRQIVAGSERAKLCAASSAGIMSNSFGHVNSRNAGAVGAVTSRDDADHDTESTEPLLSQEIRDSSLVSSPSAATGIVNGPASGRYNYAADAAAAQLAERRFHSQVSTDDDQHENQENVHVVELRADTEAEMTEDEQ